MMRVQQVQEDMNVLMDTKKIKNNKLRNLNKKLRQPSIKNVFMQPHHCTLKSKSEQEKNIKKNNYVCSEHVQESLENNLSSFANH